MASSSVQKSVLSQGSSSKTPLILAATVLTYHRVKAKEIEYALSEAWMPSAGLHLTEIGENLFYFTFFTQADLQKVVKRSPWRFRGHLVVLVQVSNPLEVKRDIFNFSPFWLHLYGIPSHRLNAETVTSIGGIMGSVTEIDLGLGTIQRRNRPYVRVKIEIPVMESLPRGFIAKMEDGEQFWVGIRIANLPNFCYWCGLLNHVEKDCPTATVEMTQTNQVRGYGNWLRSSSVSNPNLQTRNYRWLRNIDGSPITDPNLDQATTMLYGPDPNVDPNPMTYLIKLAAHVISSSTSSNPILKDAAPNLGKPIISNQNIEHPSTPNPNLMCNQEKRNQPPISNTLTYSTAKKRKGDRGLSTSLSKNVSQPDSQL